MELNDMPFKEILVGLSTFWLSSSLAISLFGAYNYYTKESKSFELTGFQWLLTGALASVCGVTTGLYGDEIINGIWEGIKSTIENRN